MTEERITRIEQRLTSIEKTQLKIYNICVGIVIGLLIGGVIFGIVTIREVIEIAT